MKRTLKQLFKSAKCLGLIYSNNKKYDYQNFNDLGFAFQDLQEYGNEIITFKKHKIMKGKYYIALINCDFEINTDYTLKECVNEIKNCYEWELNNN